MIGDPLAAGAVHDTTAWAFPAVAVTPVGAFGAVAGATGVTEFEAPLARDSPTTFVALTMKVYGVPFVSPVTVALIWPPATVLVTPPGELVTV